MRRFNAEARRCFDRKQVKTHAVVATKALAHQRARACYPILKEKQSFDEKLCFG